MKIELTQKQITDLEQTHRHERDGRVRDRIKAVLLNAEGWSNLQIAQALRIRPETVSDHLIDYRTKEKLTPANGGSVSHIDAVQASFLCDVNNQINSPGNYHQNSPGAIQKNLISFSPPGHRFSRYF